MPIIINNQSFTDAWGNVTTFYRSNAGDRTLATFNFTANIYADSVGNPFIFNPLTNEIQTSGTPFEDEGFRFGDPVICVIYSSDGSLVIDSFPAIITYIDGSILTLDNLPSIPDVTLQEIFQIQAVAIRDSLTLNLNHILNADTSGNLSLIDAEETIFKFNSLSLQVIGSAINGIPVGKQSGQYIESCTLTRLPDVVGLVGSEQKYELTIQFDNSGIYDQTWFNSSSCLKFLMNALFSRFADEPFAQTQIKYADNANTGWFDEPHNTDTFNATLVQGVTQIDYINPTNITIKVSGVTTQLGIGGSYIPQDDSYYKSQQFSQNQYGMLLPTTPLSVTTYVAQNNTVTGAGWSLQVTAITTVGSETTISAIFTPNANFGTFMEERDEEDRLFYLWVKCGNLNLLAFAGQLTYDAPAGGPLVLLSEFAFADHSENVNDTAPLFPTILYDTEDDLGYRAKFLATNNDVLQKFEVEVVAYNNITTDEFVLQNTTYDLSQAQVTAQGVTLLNETLTINSQLPATSLKIQSYLRRDNTIDTLTEYGLEIYYPIILRWEYWLQQLNANVFFYPNQNKNWQNYSQVGDWGLRVKLTLTKNDLSYTHYKGIIDYPYNNEDGIVSSIEYFRVSDGQQVTSLIDGELIRIKSTHVKLVNSWSTETWGMITIEPKESAPRWISSTAIDYDNNTNNPLQPVTGTKATLTLVADVATIECIVDCSKLSGSLFSVTAKIKDKTNGVPPFKEFKTTSPDDELKRTSPDNQFKTLA